MNIAVQRVRAALLFHGVAGEIRTFPTPVPSAAAAANELGCPVGAVANSLVFASDGAPILILASGAHRVGVGRVAAHLGVGKKKIRRADSDLVLRTTGQQVGGVAPVGHPRRVRTFVDAALERFETIWAGAGDEYSMFPTNCAELIRITGGTLLNVGRDEAS